MKSFYFILVIVILISCAQDKEEYRADNSVDFKNQIKIESLADHTTNWELIQENLQKYLKSEQFKEKSTEQYYCSEIQGSYNSYTFLTKSHYLNSFYVPPGSRIKNLQDLLTNQFNSPNPSGTYHTDIDFQFDILGADGGVLLNAENSNRLYNEFICLLSQELPSDPIFGKKRYFYSMNFIVDYFLCCTENGCCDPIFLASGRVYWN